MMAIMGIGNLARPYYLHLAVLITLVVGYTAFESTGNMLFLNLTGKL